MKIEEADLHTQTAQRGDRKLYQHLGQFVIIGFTAIRVIIVLPLIKGIKGMFSTDPQHYRINDQYQQISEISGFLKLTFSYSDKTSVLKTVRNKKKTHFSCEN